MIAIGIIIGVLGTLAVEGIILATMALEYRKKYNKYLIHRK